MRLIPIKIPTIEVHMTDISKREKFRKTSIIAKACIKQIKGLGKYSYLEAIKVLIKEK